MINRNGNERVQTNKKGNTQMCLKNNCDHNYNFTQIIIY